MAVIVGRYIGVRCDGRGCIQVSKLRVSREKEGENCWKGGNLCQGRLGG